ncbi:MAG: hypothetical protein HY827_02265 [Actinobacteria bacterium]|nr:hypothetical protein [Actinomycetota bacterium]
MLFAAAIALTLVSAGSASAKKRKDKSSPYVLKSVTRDANGDGRVDGVEITYSEKIRVAKIKKGKGKAKKKNRNKIPWTTTGKHKYVGVSVLSDGKTVLVSISENDAVDTSEKPTIAYLRVPKGARGITDRAGNQALMANIKPSDGLAPVLLSSTTRDVNNNGGIDRVTFTFSEPIASVQSPLISVTGYVPADAAIDGAAVNLSVNERGIDTQATPAATVSAGAVKDAAGNELASTQSLTVADGAAPAVIDAVTDDVNTNGRIDRVRVRYSEPITHIAESGSGAVAATGYSSISVSSATGDYVDLTIGDTTGGYNSGVKPTVTTVASASPVSDLSGNATGASTFSGTRDGAPPILVAAKSKDLDGDGHIDAISATFTEPVTYQAGPGSYFSSTTTELGTFGASATASGSSVTAVVNENLAQYNTDLPRTSPSLPLPVTYTSPVSGGASDVSGNRAASVTVQATDGAGPAIVYAETVDDSPADGHIDGVKIGFSEPIATLVGKPFKIANGARLILDDSLVSTDGEQIINSGSPGDPLYKGVSVTLYPLTTDGKANGPIADPDTADKPSVDYATVLSGSTRTDYAEDASRNEVIPTGTTAFTATTDKVRPIMLSLRAEDNTLDGSIDRLRTVWSESITTNGSPSFAALSPQNAPLSGYTPPTVTPGASTASGVTLFTPLTVNSGLDRDIKFQTQFLASGAGVADAAANNAANSPAVPVTSPAVCTDVSEGDSAGQDDTAAAGNTSGLAAAADTYLATLCAGDSDYYKFNATSGEVVSVLLAPSPEALVARIGNSYDPFTVVNPVGGAVTLSSLAYDDLHGWIGRFTASSTGQFKVGVRDASSPLLDYGYCISRTDDGSDPTCSVRQGDIVVTEVLDDVDLNPPAVGTFIEFKNVSPTPQTIDSTFTVVNGVTTCALTPYSGTNATIASGGTFYVSGTADPSKTNDFSCSGMNIQLSSPIALVTTGGTIDSVDLSSVTPATAFSVQLRASAAWETSAANDDIVNGWCMSTDPYGTWGAANNNCDEFRISEAAFLPISSDRDGQVYVEIKGVGSLTPASTLLAGWRVRIKPQGLPGAFFTLPSNANPNSSGVFVLADSPTTGSTRVPLYSIESANVASAGETGGIGTISGRNLDQYLRADRPVTVKLMRPTGGDPLTCNTSAADTLGFSPTVSGSLDDADADGVCGPAFITRYFSFPDGGYNAADVVQRDSGRDFVGDNKIDFCNVPGTPMFPNYACYGAT